MRRASLTAKLLGGLVCILQVGAAYSYAGETGREYDAKRKATIDELKGREIHIYGLVVDQQSNPVKDADVLLHWEEFSVLPGPIVERWIRAGIDGKWEFKMKATRASVREAKAPGYVFSMKQQDFGGMSSDDIKHNRTGPDSRVVLRLHRLGEPVFLLADSADLARARDEETLARQFDIYRRKTRSAAKATNQSVGTFYPDLEFKIERDKSRGSWKVTFRTPRDGDGLVMSQKLLLEAPTAGYRAELIVEGIRDNDFPRYLYLKSRVPTVYSMFDLNYSIYPDILLLSYDLFSNPYGTRSLEPNGELEPLWQLREHLTKQARTELVAGRLLDRMELLMLIKEAKTKEGR